ncbi:hypothetical protein C8A01DRAFT_21412 [Parachaetomium inaequale]|uniref:Uncharacterized protein n=1 Tax=Parachaetomium inaequale TaxID=2588326 RepID=A0AAN6SK55_9PEZI|nr:hypothetical protein C8A01DRAFT_21412 [Parachaetomium inaequale]
MDAADIDFIKKYVGQTKRAIKTRAAEHRRVAARLRQFLDGGDSVEDIQRRKGVHLLNFVWASSATRTFKFTRLGTLKGDLDDLDRPLWLNIVEMYFCLMFQSLQPGTLRQYLGVDSLDTPDSGLNIALPLYQSNRDKTIGSTCACLQSSDPEIIRYAKARLNFCLNPAREKLKELNWEPSKKNLPLRRLEELNWNPTAFAMRKASPRWRTKYRDPVPKWGEPTVVKVFCKQCGFTTLDTAPVFHIHTGAYAVRRRRCLYCIPSAADAKHRLTHARRSLYPVEPMAWIMLRY